MKLGGQLLLWSRNFLHSKNRKLLYWSGSRWKSSGGDKEWVSQLDYSSVLAESKTREEQESSQPKPSTFPVALAHLINSTQTKTKTETIQNQLCPDGKKESQHAHKREIYDLMGEVSTSDLGSSTVPCGGCGAVMHCQQKDLPGFVSAERFQRMSVKELRSEVCQRCYALQEHRTALKVIVPLEDYPRILSVIKEERAMVILLIDLLDFPCSVWSGLSGLIGTKRPVFLVGNKVDLLPQDSAKYLSHVLKVMESTVRDAGVTIRHSALISAETGYGVEDLISAILRIWGNNGHIYIVGCVNVGKSSLFNLLLSSDLCEVQTGDVIQRATVSQWPGTTLSLLKFPVLKTFPWRICRRNHRLRAEVKSTSALRHVRQFQLSQTKNPLDAIPVGHIGQSFTDQLDDKAERWNKETADLFHVNPSAMNPPLIRRPGHFNPTPFRNGTWCFDTPGVLPHNQILDVLRMEELEVLVPTTVIFPRTVILRPGKTLFLGGLVRIDHEAGNSFVRLTLFTSALLPFNISSTQSADHIYSQGLGTRVFGVPFGNEERLREFPSLLPNPLSMEGIGYGTSCADIVISSLGWVGINGARGDNIQLRVYSPGGRGICLRRPSLLPFASRLRGDKLRDAPIYSPHKIFTPQLRSF